MSGAFEPEIAQGTSTALEAQVRDLLPSVSGFGSRLGAQNVIVPVIDVTGTAEGSGLPQDLQEAWDSTTSHVQQTGNATSTIISNAGFYLVDLVTVWQPNGNNVAAATIFIDDTSTQTTIWQCSYAITGASVSLSGLENRFRVFLKAGETLKLFTFSTNVVVDVWNRQIADTNGTLINPQGFTAT